MPTITIDGHSIDARRGQTLLEAAVDLGIEIPTLCHHRDLSIDGSCRLCLVEIEGCPTQMAACSTEAAPGMTIRTESPAIVESRRAILELLLANYVEARGDSPSADSEFMRWVRRYEASPPLGVTPTARYEVDSDPNPFIRVDLNECILCTRCVRACAEIQGRFVWQVGYRGHEAKIVAGADTTMLDARCESCGACAAYCPTGALTDRLLYDADPRRKVTTTCPYCGVGCRLDLNLQEDRIVGVTSNPDAPVNGMSLCVKGRYGMGFVHHADRLQHPLVRPYLLDGGVKPASVSERGEWVEVGWDRALDLVADRLADIWRNSGPAALGVLSSAKCTNEENYLMQKFARQVLATNNIDHCARLCHASTVEGLAMALGSGAMSNSMDDIVEHSRAIFIIGSNTTEQHPVFGAMIRQAVLRRGVKLLVADPRRIDIAEFAALHLRQRPGTDVALLNGIMHVILRDDRHAVDFIADRCDGFDDFQAAVERYTPEYVAEITGVAAHDIRRAAQLLADHHPAAVIWAMGITQHTTGVLNVLSLANLQMLLGNMGIPGGGVNPLRGQNNVQGACDMGALPNVYPGYQSVADDAIRQKFNKAWACTSDGPLGVVGERGREAGLTVTEMIDAAGQGDLRGLFILGEDPALTDPDGNRARECLESAGFVVLQEILSSETAKYADVLLPGASFAEKEGTYTNTERRVQTITPAIPSPGVARPDWRITQDLALRVLARQGRRPAGAYAGWEHTSAESIMREIAALTPSYAGVSHARLHNGERLQWPVLDEDHPGTPILHVDSFPRGRGLFHAVEHLPPQELPDEEFPLLLTTGRVLYHWHGGELTRRVEGLLEACPETIVEVSDEDAARLRVEDNALVRVVSRRGEMLARAKITPRVATGTIFGNFHFPGAANVNNLTIAALDPVAKIPEYKVCAVRIEAVEH
jgi:formate dehydrogenase major subunit/formate dehydrogenase alpha subunit